MDRPDIFKTMLDIASVLAVRAMCQKRQVGCVLTDDKNNIVGTGYNGRPRGLANCSIEKPCLGGCDGVHAEINALIQSSGKSIKFCYTTCAPCWHCVKALVNTDCQVLIFKDISTWETRSEQLWLSLGRKRKWVWDDNYLL
jgi:dCMP deaminase